MDKRTKELRKLMKLHKLTNAAVAEMLNRTEQTVRIWRCKYPDRIIPEHALELLRMKVAQL